MGVFDLKNQSKVLRTWENRKNLSAFVNGH